MDLNRLIAETTRKCRSADKDEDQRGRIGAFEGETVLCYG